MAAARWTKVILCSILFAAFFLNSADVLVDDGPKQGFLQWINHPAYHLQSNSLVRFPFTMYEVLIDDASRKVYHDWPEFIQDRQAFSKALNDQMVIFGIATIICAALCFLPVVMSILLLTLQRKSRALGKLGKWIQQALGVLCAFIGLAAFLIWGGGLGTLVIGSCGIGLVYLSRSEHSARTAFVAPITDSAAAGVGVAEPSNSVGNSWRQRRKSRFPFSAEEWQLARDEVDARHRRLAEAIRSSRGSIKDVTTKEN